MSVLGSLYSIPPTFFDGAVATGAAGDATNPANLGAAALPELLQRTVLKPSPTAEGGQWNENGATCLACGIGVLSAGFASAAEQRIHFKCDWHRYNVKRRLSKLPAVSEEQFELLISQQDSEVCCAVVSTAQIPHSNTVHAAMARQARSKASHCPYRCPASQAPAAVTQKGRTVTEAAGATRGEGDSSAQPHPRPCFVPKCLLQRDHVRSHAGPDSPHQLLAELQRLRQCRGQFVIILLRGGHFAAAVFRARPAPGSAKAAAQPSGGSAAPNSSE
ncbi:ANK_REP_REGION domain-containing protein, partial [Haematococcus lacustris]